tara:strand:- start:137 stop:268 length:132 start_codon:yes stop_codon:yes gene_type:complete
VVVRVVSTPRAIEVVVLEDQAAEEEEMLVMTLLVLEVLVTLHL